MINTHVSVVRLKPDTASTKPDITLTELCIDFLEVPAIHQHLTRLAAGTGGHEPLRLHHVHETRGPAEPDAHLPLQIRNRDLAAADDDARGFVVELVLLVFDAAGPGFLFVRRNGVVEHRLALLAQKA